MNETRNVTRNYFQQLDGLRGVAIILVVIFHFSVRHQDMHSDHPGFFLQLAQLGWVGVDLFFVISGFLITSILLETKTRAHYFRNFLARRSLRIWPLYYAVLVFMFVLVPLVVPAGVQMPEEFASMQRHSIWFWLYAANWLFTINGGLHDIGGGFFWSVAVEEQFYIFWPFAVYYLSKSSLLRLSLGLLVLSIIARPVMLGLGINPDATYTATFSHMDGLALGSIMAIAYRDQWLTQVTAGRAGWAAAISVALIAMAGILDGDWFFWGHYMALFGYLSVAVLSAVALQQLLRDGVENTFVYTVLVSRPLVATGRYSYALYLFHVPVSLVAYKIVFRLLNSSWWEQHYTLAFAIYFLVAFVVAWTAAWLSWHLFEKHILKLKVHFSS